jgi:hypothetical protein
LFIDQHWLSAGPPRFIAAGALMLAVTLFTERGLAGIPAQVRSWLGDRRGRREAGGTGTQVRKESLT